MTEWTQEYLDHLDTRFERNAKYLGQRQFDEAVRDSQASIYIPEDNRRVLHQDFAFETPYLSNDVLQWFDLTGFQFEFYLWERESTIKIHRQRYFVLLFDNDFCMKTFKLAFDL